MYYRRALKLQAFLDMASESGKCVIAFSPITFGQAWYMRPLLLFYFFYVGLYCLLKYLLLEVIMVASACFYYEQRY